MSAREGERYWFQDGTMCTLVSSVTCSVLLCAFCRWCWQKRKVQMKYMLSRYWRKTSSFRMMMLSVPWQKNEFWHCRPSIHSWQLSTALFRQRSDPNPTAGYWDTFCLVFLNKSLFFLTALDWLLFILNSMLFCLFFFMFFRCLGIVIGRYFRILFCSWH